MSILYGSDVSSYLGRRSCAADGRPEYPTVTIQSHVLKG